MGRSGHPHLHFSALACALIGLARIPKSISGGRWSTAERALDLRALASAHFQPQLSLNLLPAIQHHCHYTKGAGKHGSHKRMEKLENLGAASYIYVRKFASMAFDNLDFTSLDCPSLASPTYLQVPRTHVVFSLASFSRSITTQAVRNLTLATLCPESSALFTFFLGHRDALYACVKELQRTIKNASSTQ
ncbi:hypothetical protein DFP72DRAFT_1059047 [Ephemerocybe angulata]|uniref:Uncharacterized protein n=1 Tax=Ephemerocybe angulata TaxID=980116 RepID=A0A8H6IGK7_9AGAR|nr:hypothetical protein DFP72DRAFT_1059047 [Tulosesus angulatus]